MVEYRDFSDAQLSAPNFETEKESPGIKNYDVDFTRLLYMQHNEMDLSILHADQKAQLILGVVAVLIAALSSGISLTGGFVVLEGIVLVLLVISMYFALRVVMPRFRKVGFKGNMYFFGDIVEMSSEDYISAYMNMTLQDVKVSIMQQIHEKSHIVYRKYSNVQRSLTFLLLALAAWTIAWVLPNVFGL